KANQQTTLGVPIIRECQFTKFVSIIKSHPVCAPCSVKCKQMSLKSHTLLANVSPKVLTRLQHRRYRKLQTCHKAQLSAVGGANFIMTLLSLRSASANLHTAPSLLPFCNLAIIVGPLLVSLITPRRKSR
ncbi:unnamed protein product, partial [Tenebrio molitor]